MKTKAILLLILIIYNGCSPSTKNEQSNIMSHNPNDTWTSDALQNGEVNAVKERVLNEPEYLFARDYLGDTPLLTAIAFDNLELVTFLLEQGADPNIPVDDGYTCLLSAVESEAPVSIKIVEALIVAGADIHFAGTSGWTPLHMAAARGYTEKAQHLITAGADVNRRTDIDGDVTPLMEAAYMGQPDTVKLLLNSGADASLRDIINNRTALETAKYVAAGPDPEVYEVLTQENMQIDADDVFDDIDLPPDQLEKLKEDIGKVNMAETYLQNSKDIVASGNHAEVIRILTGHRSGQ